jgi:hypothetical protein
MELIPTDSAFLYWDQNVALDGVTYKLSFRYNNREEVYYLTIASLDGSTVYVAGLKLVSDIYLLGPYTTPPGELIAITSGNDDSPASVGDWGVRVNLYYVPQSDMIANALDPTRNPYVDENAT